MINTPSNPSDNAEVRFKNQGLDSIEVHDNGGGISPQNYETVALKHYTSKLNTYDDLGTLETFGFRGEALSSLCALSNFAIITCTAEAAPKGTKLDFETSGQLKGQSVVAAQKGTTVLVEGLFKNLPVRRQELQRNIKREWTKVINVVGQYACIQMGVKITVTHQPAKGKKTTIFATRGNKTTRENIANVFGAKTLSALIPLDLKLALETTSGPIQRHSTQEDGPSQEIRIVGHISKPVFGEGRQTPDKQMFFVNSRPCGLPQVAKVFNEVYRSFNNAQSPFIFANIELDTHGYDVNVSPDKRTIMLHEQSRMLEALRTELTSMFEAQEYSVPAASAKGAKLATYKQLTINHEVPTASSPEVTKTPAWKTIPPPRAPTRGASGIDDEAEDESPAPRRPSAVTFRDTTPVNLISNWSDNHAGHRPLLKMPKDIRDATLMERAIGGAGLSKEKLKLIDKFSRERFTSDERAEGGVETEGEREEEETAIENSAPHSTPQAVRDFNAHIKSIDGARQASREGSVANSDATPHRIAPIFLPQHAPETPIPAVPHLIVRTNSKINSIMGRITRPRRLSEEEATITIDGRTIHSSIETPSKKQRVDGSPARNTKASLFGSKLSQAFAAPGSRIAGSDSEDGKAEDNEQMGEDDHEMAPPRGLTAEGEESLFVEQGDDTTMPEAPIYDYPEDDSIDDRDQAAIHDPSIFDSVEADNSADGYLGEDEKRSREDAKIAAMIAAAEARAAIPTEEQIKRSKLLLNQNLGLRTLQCISQRPSPQAQRVSENSPRHWKRRWGSTRKRE